MLFYCNVCLVSSFCNCIVVFCTVMLGVWLYCHFGNHVEPRKNSCCNAKANGDIMKTNKQTNKTHWTAPLSSITSDVQRQPVTVGKVICWFNFGSKVLAQFYLYFASWRCTVRTSFILTQIFALPGMNCNTKVRAVICLFKCKSNKNILSPRQ